MKTRYIFKKFGEAYLNKYNPNCIQKTTYKNIIACRTNAYGKHTYECKHCNHKITLYNSCKNRHCPVCQNYKKINWLNNQNKLNMECMHIVMVVPIKLRPIFYYNKETYDILFDASIKALNKQGIGVTSILHTWSQKGNFHPHIHMIVTKQCLSNNRLKEITYNIEKIKENFKNNIFELLKDKKFTFYKDYEYLNDKDKLNKYLEEAKDEEFTCFIKDNNIENTYEYLSEYIFKVWISDDRILKITDKYVYFKYLDREINKEKVMKIKGEEFIKKYLMHVLPKNFVKVRHYGLFAGKNRNKRIKELKILLHIESKKTKTKQAMLTEIMGKDITRCPKCGGPLELVYKNKPPSKK